MSIPLDRLYHYIESIARGVREDNVVIYHFFPHGSKNIKDLNPLAKSHTYWSNYLLNPHIYCNDQEPLDYDYYQSSDHVMPGSGVRFNDIVKSILPNRSQHNLRGSIATVHDQAIILHSEKRSAEVAKYQENNYIPVYYWSHALIARDWFRYAKHTKLEKSVKKRFLIYNRAWSGTREYRLGFADRLLGNSLEHHCLMRVSPIDSTLDKHYDLHTFEREHWRPRNVIEDYFPLCEAESHCSADFEQEDYEATDIEVVLETLFDDLRLHLTEKTLRPIAMGQPFILAATYGSLQYLREYGFKTFSDCWDESYDMMTDSIDRMNKIIQIMREIANMEFIERERMLERARAIADYNRQHFFSKEFETRIQQELVDNLSTAFNKLEDTNTSSLWLKQREKLFKNEIIQSKFSDPDLYLNQQLIDTVDSIANDYKLRTLSNK